MANNSSSADCTPDTCPTGDAFLRSPHSLGASAFLLAAFGALAVANALAGLRHRTWLYSAALVAGLLLDAVGYAGRVLLRTDPARKSYFLAFLLGTVLGPTLVGAAVCFVLPRVLGVYGQGQGQGQRTGVHAVLLRPLVVELQFLAFAVFALVFQVIGCTFVVDGVSEAEMAQGMDLLIVGMVIQVAGLGAFFATLYRCFWRLVLRRQPDPGIWHLYLGTRFKIFLLCLQTSAVLIFIRTVFRTVQFASGLDSPLAQSQVLTTVLDGVVMLLAALLLTILPPGAAFGRDAWARTSPHRPRAVAISDGRSPPGDGFPVPRSPQEQRQQRQQQGSPYQTTYTQTKFPSPFPSHHEQEQEQQGPQVPGHWQFPGYQLPRFGKHAVAQATSHEQTAAGSSLATSGSPPPPRPPPYEISVAMKVPYMPPPPPTARSRSPGRLLAGGNRRTQQQQQQQHERERSVDVVDPDTLWD